MELNPECDVTGWYRLLALDPRFGDRCVDVYLAGNRIVEEPKLVFVELSAGADPI